MAGLYKLFVSNRLTLKSVLMFTNSHFLTDWLTDGALKYLVPEALLLGSYSVWPGSVSGIDYFLEATFEIEDYFDVHIFTLSECLWLRVCCPRNTLLGVLICVTRECLRDGIFLAILPLETLHSGQYHYFTSHDIRSKLFLATCVWWEADWLNVYWIYCVWLFNNYSQSSLSHAHQRWSRCW